MDLKFRFYGTVKKKVIFFQGNFRPGNLRTGNFDRDRSCRPYLRKLPLKLNFKSLSEPNFLIFLQCTYLILRRNFLKK